MGKQNQKFNFSCKLQLCNPFKEPSLHLDSVQLSSLHALPFSLYSLYMYETKRCQTERAVLFHCCRTEIKSFPLPTIAGPSCLRDADATAVIWKGSAPREILKPNHWQSARIFMASRHRPWFNRRKICRKLGEKVKQTQTEFRGNCKPTKWILRAKHSLLPY